MFGTFIQRLAQHPLYLQYQIQKVIILMALHNSLNEQLSCYQFIIQYLTAILQLFQELTRRETRLLNHQRKVNSLNNLIAPSLQPQDTLLELPEWQ